MERKDFIKLLGLGGISCLLPSHAVASLQNTDTELVSIYDNYVRGVQFYRNKHEQIIKQTDKIILKRDADNIYDKFAVQIFVNDKPIGHIAAYENIAIANMLDAGFPLFAEISSLQYENNRLQNISVRISTYQLRKDRIIKLSKNDDTRADDQDDLYRQGVPDIIYK